MLLGLEGAVELMVGWTLLKISLWGDPTWLVNSGWNGVAVVKQTHIMDVRACQGSLDCRLRLRLDYGPKCTNKPMQIIKDTGTPKLMSPLAINLKAFPYGLPWTSRISKKKSANGYADSQPPFIPLPNKHMFYILSTNSCYMLLSWDPPAPLQQGSSWLHIASAARAGPATLTFFGVNLYRCPAGLQSMSSMTLDQAWSSDFCTFHEPTKKYVNSA